MRPAKKNLVERSEKSFDACRAGTRDMLLSKCATWGYRQNLGAESASCPAPYGNRKKTTGKTISLFFWRIRSKRRIGLIATIPFPTMKAQWIRRLLQVSVILFIRSTVPPNRHAPNIRIGCMRINGQSVGQVVV